jgi:hypothetical protein
MRNDWWKIIENFKIYYFLSFYYMYFLQRDTKLENTFKSISLFTALLPSPSCLQTFIFLGVADIFDR